MEAITKAYRILKNEGYGNFIIKEISSGGGLMINNEEKKIYEIWIDEKHRDNIFFLIHEIAHIKYPNHNSLWGDYFTNLLSKYLI